LQKSAKSSYFAENIADTGNKLTVKDFGSMVIPLPPCFSKKRLEGVENKGSGLENTKKRGCMWLKTLRGSLQMECKR
jgi:hypothetical protein